jgi:hypothetical protein
MRGGDDGADVARGRADACVALLLVALAAPLLLLNLGGPALWSDEGDTAVFARTIRDTGLPWAWDGRTFTESDRGRRLTEDLLLVGTPWLPYYVTAGSFALFGESAFTARLPFALAGIAAVLLLHRLVLRQTGDRRAALAAALLLLASVPFLLYVRQCRHYALNMALGLLAVHGFLRLRQQPRHPGLAIAGVLLFHCHPLPAAAVLGGLGGLAIVSRTHRGALRPLLAWAAPIALLTLPFMAWSWSGWEENSSLLASLAELPARLGQALAESGAALPLLGWLALFALARRRLTAADRQWLLLAGALVAAHLALVSLALSARQLWEYGLRYVCLLLPLGAGITGVLAARAAPRAPALAAVLLLFAATWLPSNALLYALAPAERKPGLTEVAVHVPRDPAARWLRLELFGFARELWRHDPGSVSHISDWLAAHAGPEDVIITNYAWDPIYFHTRLRQGLKILPHYEIHDAARARGLPEYVFSVEGADFVIWRWPWLGYQGYQLDQIRAAVEARGARLERVAVLPETVWENRPELHFHRFPGLGHLFPFGMQFQGYGLTPGAPVFRVVPGAETPP